MLHTCSFLSVLNTQGKCEIVNMVSVFTEYFVKLMIRLDLPGGKLFSAEFDNIAAVLLLIEELILESSESQQDEIKHVICDIADVAKAASLLLEHLNDQGTTLVLFLVHKDH